MDQPILVTLACGHQAWLYGDMRQALTVAVLKCPNCETPPVVVRVPDEVIQQVKDVFQKEETKDGTNATAKIY
jgi:hypothetical protein